METIEWEQFNGKNFWFPLRTLLGFPASQIKENFEEGVDIYNFLKAFLKAQV